MVTFGIYSTSAGTRRTTALPDETSIRAAIIEMWADYFVGEAYAVLHIVRPQEYLVNAEIHFIIEFGNRVLPLPREDIPILRRTTWHEVWHDAEPVASYVSQRLSPQEVINQCGLSEWCNAHTRTTCNLHVEKSICLPLVRVQLSPGSLVEIFIHFNPVEEEDETSLFQPFVEASHPTHHDSINCRTWPEPNEELQRLIQEVEEVEPEVAVPVVGTVVFDDPNEWTRLAVATEQPAHEQIQVVVHGLLYEEIGVRRLYLPSLSTRLMEEMTEGLWPELDYLNKVIYLVSPQPLQGSLEEVTIILEFYEPWLARDLSFKPILLECPQPEFDVIHRITKYCPERVTKENFPIEPSGCPVEGDTLSVQIWIQNTPLQLHQECVVQAGNLVTLRYTPHADSIEDWIQHFFPGALNYKKSISNATALEHIGTTSWTFLEKVQSGEPSRQYTSHPPWLRFHDPYFVVQAFLEMMTHRQTGYDNYRIYEVLGSPRTQMTFLYAENRDINTVSSKSPSVPSGMTHGAKPTAIKSEKDKLRENSFERSIWRVRISPYFVKADLSMMKLLFSAMVTSLRSNLSSVLMRTQQHQVRRRKAVMKFQFCSSNTMLRRTKMSPVPMDGCASPIPLWVEILTTSFLFDEVTLAETRSLSGMFRHQTGLSCQSTW